jgi:hypothetical protein
MLQFGEVELTHAPHLRPLRQRLSEIALGYYQELIELRRDDPAARAELAATRARVEGILADLAVLEGAGQLFLLAEPAVLDDLRLTDEQRGRVAELHRRAADRSRAEFRGFHRLSPAARRERFVALARAAESDIAAALTPDQVGRLRQIALQRQGLAAFREPDVVAALKLTPDQRDRIQAVEFDATFGPPGSQPRSAEQSLRWAVRRARGVLTEEQRAKWDELAGAPFTARPPAPPPPPPRSR